MSDKAKRVSFKSERKFAMVMCGGQNARVRDDFNSDWSKLQQLALIEIEATLAELPQPLREQAQKLPVTFERAPNVGLQADGIAPDTLGLFTGAEFADDGARRCPRRLFCFSKTSGILRKAMKKCFARKFAQLFCMSWDIFLA